MSRTKHPDVHIRGEGTPKLAGRRWMRRNVLPFSDAPRDVRRSVDVQSELVDMALPEGADCWADVFTRYGKVAALALEQQYQRYADEGYQSYLRYGSDSCKYCGCYDGCDCDRCWDYDYSPYDDDYDHWRDRVEPRDPEWVPLWLEGRVDAPVSVEEQEYEHRMSMLSVEHYYATSDHVGCTCDECSGVYYDGCDNWPGEDEFFGWPVDSTPVADLAVLVRERWAEKSRVGDRRRAA